MVKERLEDICREIGRKLLKFGQKIRDSTSDKLNNLNQGLEDFQPLLTNEIVI